MGRKLKRETTPKEVAESIKSKTVEKEESVDPDHLIPTGSTLYNLALSDNPFGGYGMGRVANLIGDESAGKSFLAISCLAEMANNPQFDDYDLIYDDIEQALGFDIVGLFGEKTAKRVKLDMVSDTIETLYGNVRTAISNERPFIYIPDSWDALDSKEGQERAEEYRQGKIPDGSYKTEKAKLGGEILRNIKADLRGSESSLLIISQTRDNIGFGAQFKPKVRSGGKALDFYASHITWLAIRERDKRRNREIGIFTEAKTTKNKLTGKRRTVEIPIYYDIGIDDVRANIRFLINEEYWKKEKKSIVVPEFDYKGMMDGLIEKIEKENLEKELSRIVAQCWYDIEEDLKLDRKPRYE